MHSTHAKLDVTVSGSMTVWRTVVRRAILPVVALGFFLALQPNSLQAAPIMQTDGETSATLTAEINESLEETAALLDDGEDEEALDVLQGALDAAVDTGDIEYITDAYDSGAQVLRSVEKFEHSIDLLSELLDLQETASFPGTGQTLAWIGADYAALEEHETAFEFFDRAVEAALDAGEDRLAVAVLAQAGDQHSELEEHEAALESFLMMREVAEDSGDLAQVMAALDEIGALYRSSADYPASIEAYQELLTLQRDLGDLAGEAQTLAWLGANYAELEEFDDAFSTYDEAAQLAQTAEKPALAYAVLRAAGQLRTALEEYPQAVTTFQEALAVAEQLKDLDRISDMTDRIGQAQRSSGDFLESIETYTTLVQIQEEQDDLAGMAQSLAWIGANYADAEQYSEAFDYFDRAVATAKEDGNSRFAFTVLRSAGDLQRDLEAFGDAADLYTAAVEVAEEMGNDDLAAVAYDRLAATERTAKNYVASNQAYNALLDLQRAGDDQAGAAQTLAWIGTNYADLGQLDRAFEIFDDAVAVATAAGDAPLAAAVLRTKGDTLRKQENFAVAATQYSAGAALAARGGDHETAAKLYERAAEMYVQARADEETRDAYAGMLEAALSAGDQVRIRTARRALWNIHIRAGNFAEAAAAANSTIGITLPRDGAIVRGQVNVEGLVMDPDFRKWQVDLLIDGEESGATFLATRKRARWGPMFSFDSTRYPNGIHKLRLRIVHQDTNYDEYFTDIEIRN